MKKKRKQNTKNTKKEICKGNICTCSYKRKKRKIIVHGPTVHSYLILFAYSTRMMPLPCKNQRRRQVRIIVILCASKDPDSLWRRCVYILNEASMKRQRIYDHLVRKFNTRRASTNNNNVYIFFIKFVNKTEYLIIYQFYMKKKKIHKRAQAYAHTHTFI